MVETDQRITAVVDQLVMRGWHRSHADHDPHTWSVTTAPGWWPRQVDLAHHLFITVNGHYSLWLTGEADAGLIWGWATLVRQPGQLPLLIIDRQIEWPGLNAALLTAWERWQDYRASTDGEAS